MMLPGGQCNNCPKTTSGRQGGCFPGQEVNSEPWETGPMLLLLMDPISDDPGEPGNRVTKLPQDLTEWSGKLSRRGPQPCTPHSAIIAVPRLLPSQCFFGALHLKSIQGLSHPVVLRQDSWF